jgi:alkylglycerol monooxygenase
VITTGAMLEQRRWIFHLEFARLTLFGILTCLSYPSFNLGVFILMLGALVVIFYKSIGKLYYSYLYNRK